MKSSAVARNRGCWPFRVIPAPGLVRALLTPRRGRGYNLVVISNDSVEQTLERGTQLTLGFVSDAPRRAGDLVTTRQLEEHPSRGRVVRMVRFARRFFPELKDVTIKVGLARGADGYASLDEPKVWLNPRHLNYQTVSHELVHLLQWKGLVPMGERSCDVYSLARSLMLVDAAPVYLKIPANLLADNGELRPGAPRLLFNTAREALQRRSNGTRQYIRWFEKAIAEPGAHQGGA